MQLDYKIKLNSGKTVSLEGMRITFLSTHCDVECLKCRYELTQREANELEQIILGMFRFISE